MRIAVFGAGAIGAFLGARLISAGEQVALIARGPHLEAMRKQGLRVRSPVFGEWEGRPHATDRPEEVGPVDVVVLGVKAHALSAVAPKLAPLLGPETTVLSTQNGVPWWYFHGLGDRWVGARLESVDPGGTIASHIEGRRVVGSIVYCSCRLAAPGVVDHLEDIRCPLGEPSGAQSERVRELARALRNGGLKAPVRADIRHEIWVKLLGNATLNPISALSRATLQEITEFPPARELVAAMMEEVRVVAAELGVKIGISVEQRIEGARRVGHHKTSMLQDLEAGRPLELDPILGAVIELAGQVGVPVPQLRTVYACTRLLVERGKMSLGASSATAA